MSNTRNLRLFLLEKFLNHDITADELRHCKRPDFLRISVFMASKSFLLTLPNIGKVSKKLLDAIFGRVDKLVFRVIDEIRFMDFKCDKASFFISVFILF